MHITNKNKQIKQPNNKQTYELINNKKNKQTNKHTRHTMITYR